MKIRKADVGRLALVKWDDIGRVECMIVDHDRCGYPVVYNFNDRKLDTLDDHKQVVEMGDFVTPNGLLESRVKVV